MRAVKSLNNPKILLKGNEAVIYGALLAGCDCYFGYPITPASEIAHAAALLFPKLGRCFLQAESEISAINMVLGAASVGRLSMTASSGPGISLKQEGVSYIARSELPAVIVDIMRSGPGLGNIGPEQTDYRQVVKGGGHGCYRCPVLAPSSAQEMCDFTMDAFTLAWNYRTPVYVLTDGVIGQMIEAVHLPDPVDPPASPDWALDGTAKSKGRYITSCYLDYDTLEKMNWELIEKYHRIERAEQRAELYHCEDADLVLIGYGIVGRILRGAVELLRSQGVKAGMLRPLTLFPLPVDHLRDLAKRASSFLCVEMSEGQLIDDIRLAINCAIPVHGHFRMGGNTPTIGEVVSKVCEIRVQKEA